MREARPLDQGKRSSDGPWGVAVVAGIVRKDSKLG